MLFEEGRQQRPNIVVVVDDEKMGHRSHSPEIAPRIGAFMSAPPRFVSTRTQYVAPRSNPISSRQKSHLALLLHKQEHGP
jgi:hypothetical protein